MRKSKHVCKLGIMAVPGQNRGDDAIATCLVEGFRRQRQDLEFVVPVLKKGIFSDDPSIETFLLNRRTPLGLLRLAFAICSVDAVVVGAGSVIQDKLGGGYIRGMLGYGWTVAFLCKLFRKPTATSPIGIDELSSEKSRKVARQFLTRVEKLFVRDPLSQKVGEKILGVESAKSITTVCDTVFYWGAERPPTEKKEDYYVLSPAFEGRDEGQIIDLFKETILTLAAKNKARFCLVSLVDRDDEDSGKLGLILEALPPDIRSRTFIKKPKTALEAKDILCSSLGIVAMRLHALIIGYGSTNLYCLSRTTKTDGLMQAYDIPGMKLSDIQDIASAARTVCNTVTQNDGLEAKHRAKVPALKAKLDDYYKTALNYFDAAIAR